MDGKGSRPFCNLLVGGFFLLPLSLPLDCTGYCELQDLVIIMAR